MNIFLLHNDPTVAAQMQCDKHVVKMILELAQMLSTAHRILDGQLRVEYSKSGRKRKTYVHSNPEKDSVLYKATHINHPCSIWVRSGSEQYSWAYEHFIALCHEYSYRYNKTHKTDKLLSNVLRDLPENLPNCKSVQYPLAMPENFIKESKWVGSLDDAIKCYRDYYQSKQKSFKMIWSKRSTPYWFTEYRG